jgi:hypothetical protein
VILAQLTLGFWDKPTVVVLGCSLMDELAYAFFTDGMKPALVKIPSLLLPFLISMLLGWMLVSSLFTFLLLMTLFFGGVG